MDSIDYIRYFLQHFCKESFLYLFYRQPESYQIHRSVKHIMGDKWPDYHNRIVNYFYMKYDDVSDFPPTDPLSERFWSTNIVNTAIIGINSNLTNSRRTHQTEWLDKTFHKIS